MIKDENRKVKEIDKKILAELRKKLEIRKDGVDIVRQEEREKIFKKINEKKQVIFLLFQGDFSVNQQNIKERMYMNKQETDFYDKIVNKVISRRIEEIFNRIMSLEPEDGRLISVCMDRQLFIQKVIGENVKLSFIDYCIKKDCIEK